jgi:hypothetical protein
VPLLRKRFADYQRADPPGMREVLAGLPNATERWLAGVDDHGRALPVPEDVDAMRQRVLARGVALAAPADAPVCVPTALSCYTTTDTPPLNPSRRATVLCVCSMSFAAAFRPPTSTASMSPPLPRPSPLPTEKRCHWC